MRKNQATKALVHTLKRMFEHNTGAGEVLQEMPHWEFNVASPLPGDKRHFGILDFQIEKMKLPDRAKAQLTLGFFTTGIVGYSKKGKGWLFFSSGAKGQSELAVATKSQIRDLPNLPSNWEDFAVEVE